MRALGPTGRWRRRRRRPLCWTPQGKTRQLEIQKSEEVLGGNEVWSFNIHVSSSYLSPPTKVDIQPCPVSSEATSGGGEVDTYRGKEEKPEEEEEREKGMKKREGQILRQK